LVDVDTLEACAEVGVVPLTPLDTVLTVELSELSLRDVDADVLVDVVVRTGVLDVDESESMTVLELVLGDVVLLVKLYTDN